ncbi:MAG: DUF5916 domain-containing protein [Melioribacteraceae bacterium]|nr:DUF5916 domain-containing protein [Melioribacteraceae bacterium]
MRIFKVLFLLLMCFTLIFSQESKTLKLKKISGEIEIDGIIDETWSVADSISDFVQFQPFHGNSPTEQTVAKLLSNETSLYCLMICYDNSGSAEYQTGTLDDSGGDIVSLMLDTFGDKRSAYKFGVAASGTRVDARLLDDARNRDYNWDGIWFADSKKYPWGYVIEMEIPYKSIQYDKNLTEWGLDFDRWIPNNNEDIYWCEYEENQGQRISKFGRLIFDNFQPTISGLNLEFYPVGLIKAELLDNDKYKFEPQAGIDIFYNPSQALTFQLTGNPDFAQIEADPFDFNISRYESYFSERRPFFIEGQEVFNPSGKERNTGFYSPLELFYSRRIGKKLPDGKEVPLLLGTRAFGRFGEWEYGGFMAMTGETEYHSNGETKTEKEAYFASARVKKQIFENSSIGMLYVGKYEEGNTYGVLDIDGALRTDNWQLSYQFARSFKNNEGDFASSIGFVNFGENWANLFRGRFIGNKFDIDQLGFVPWKGTAYATGITGPRWYYEDGYVRQMMLYGGGYAYYEHNDLFTDYGGLIGINFNFRDGWGFEINSDLGKSRDNGVEYNSFSVTLSSWYNTSAKWNANLYGGYQHTYNFSRNYLAFYSWVGSSFSWNALNTLSLGTSFDTYIEGNPDGNIEDIVFNARPFFSFTPVNDLNIKMYIDNVFVRSTNRMERIIFGFFFAYNFLPKSWIYFAVNEYHDRSPEFDSMGNVLSNRMHVTSRAAVFKIKYLYYL